MPQEQLIPAQVAVNNPLGPDKSESSSSEDYKNAGFSQHMKMVKKKEEAARKKEEAAKKKEEIAR